MSAFEGKADNAAMISQRQLLTQSRLAIAIATSPNLLLVGGVRGKGCHIAREKMLALRLEQPS
jgi:hypothetical protein